jgi:hypothetical protein
MQQAQTYALYKDDHSPSLDDGDKLETTPLSICERWLNKLRPADEGVLCGCTDNAVDLSLLTWKHVRGSLLREK